VFGKGHHYERGRISLEQRKGVATLLGSTNRSLCRDRFSKEKKKKKKEACILKREERRDATSYEAPAPPYRGRGKTLSYGK